MLDQVYIAYENFERYLEDHNVEHNKTKKLACYLISLFYKSGFRYNCSRSKINALLIIYKFCSVQFDSDCFSSGFKTSGPYMIISDLANFLGRDIYRLFTENADNKEEYTGTFNARITIPDIYRCDESLISEQSKMLLEIIFRRYGSYSKKDLALLINEIHPHIPFREKYHDYRGVSSCNNLGASDLLEFLNSEENNIKFRDNEIFAFIKDFNYDLLKNNGVIDELYMRTSREKTKIK